MTATTLLSGKPNDRQSIFHETNTQTHTSYFTLYVHWLPTTPHTPHYMFIGCCRHFILHTICSLVTKYFIVLKNWKPLSDCPRGVHTVTVRSLAGQRVGTFYMPSLGEVKGFDAEPWLRTK